MIFTRFCVYWIKKKLVVASHWEIWSLLALIYYEWDGTGWGGTEWGGTGWGGTGRGGTGGGGGVLGMIDKKILCLGVCN